MKPRKVERPTREVITHGKLMVPITTPGKVMLPLLAVWAVPQGGERAFWGFPAAKICFQAGKVMGKVTTLGER